MTVPEGHFQLYPSLVPPLPAGDYRFTSTQTMGASGPDGALGADDLAVAPLQTHVRVTSCRFQLPPDQVLSTYPPANTEGSYAARLPQVVIKRRTLPWERSVDFEGETPVDTPRTPWLALVLIAPGEGELVVGAPVAECVTPGQVLPGPPDVPVGNYLTVRASQVRRVFPTQQDVEVLAHVREVDVSDTELMMGDDDGWLSVVIGNRLPLPGVGPDGAEVPMTYLACLVSLEGQLELLPTDPPPFLVATSYLPVLAETVLLATDDADHVAMGGDEGVERYNEHVERAHGGAAAHGGPLAAAAPVDRVARKVAVAGDQARLGVVSEGWKQTTTGVTDGLYASMADGFRIRAPLGGRALDPEYRFPVLLHWRFTSTGNVDFEYLMKTLRSGLLGTEPESAARPDGRLPLEVTETGHVGLDQRTRVGDTVRAWYRGPLLPHPADLESPRLPLAHAADQLRAVVPDRREDLSLAVAFEVGRLLALSQPSMVAALLRWRQGHYQAARRTSVLGPRLADLTWLGIEVVAGRDVGRMLGRGLARQIALTPAEVLGDPLPRVTRGTDLGLDLDPATALSTGLGVGVPLEGTLPDLAATLRSTTVPVLDPVAFSAVELGAMVRDGVRTDLAVAVDQIGLDALKLRGTLGGPGAGGVGGIGGIGGLPGGGVLLPHADPAPDALDAALSRTPTEEDRP
ncbi:hypothetical protein [Phycicoccus sp.]|uniref:hypothetical protein n=1 Tax=Phycicoccus sp. TaxID=1902410 RepID=UPI002BE492DD|nr:hypothetical protein [Phycicoccus sp.]HMM93830.1 hypothetical protein [Phycicoccus sp.]